MNEPNRTSRAARALWNRRHPQWAPGRPDEVVPHLEVTPRALPRYAFDHLAIRARTRLRGPQPWITADAMSALDQLLRPSDRGIEYGAGGTTPWFAARVDSVISIEGVDEWHAALSRRLETEGITNVDLHLVSAAELGYETPEHRAAYVGVAPDLAPASLDFAFVDGEYRDACMTRSMELLRPGGLLILDNADSYLPADTRSPWHVDRPVTAGWEQVAERIASWRRLWTTNGVWDTAIWIKP